jgi:DNA-binding transcriptional MerR regulator
MKSAALRIGELAARSGVSIDAVRFYERKKLLPLAPRTEGGFRLFPLETVERVRFIKQAQELGFSLDEVAELLTTGCAAECQQVRDLLRAKLTELDERMRLMQDFRRRLASHLTACERELRERGKAAVCPVVIKISHPEVRRKKKR